MGSYLSQPVTDKETETGSGDGLEWTSCCMQGWRVKMEDAHLAVAGLSASECKGAGSSSGSKFALFGVFDGHGGREVAHFCKVHLVDVAIDQVRHVLRKDKGGEDVDVDVASKAFVRTFNRMDDLLRDPRFETELLSYKNAVGSAEIGEDGAPGTGRHSVNEVASQVQDRLHAAITMDMQRARERGTLSTEDAMRIMKGTAMLQRLEQAGHRASQSGAVSVGPLPGMAGFAVGCTAVCVMVTPTHVVCANAGDSRAVLSRAGNAVALSWDHKPNNASERRRIEESGSEVKEVTTPGANGRKSRTMYRVNGDLNLSRAIGDLRHKTRPDLRPEKQAVTSTPDIHAEARTPGDEFIVLACDGIWDVKTNAEVCTFVRTGLAMGRDVRELLEELLDACLTPDPKTTQGLGADNMTVMVVKFEGAEIKIVEAKKKSVGCGFCLRFPGMR